MPMPPLARAVLRSKLTWLLLVAPLSWAAAVAAPDTPWPFTLAAVSIVPLAG